MSRRAGAAYKARVRTLWLCLLVVMVSACGSRRGATSDETGLVGLKIGKG